MVQNGLKHTPWKTLIAPQWSLKYLMGLTTWIGLPQEIFRNNRFNFTSHTMKQFSAMTRIKQIKILPYHPQMDGMIKRFNSTFKWTLMKLTQRRDGNGTSYCSIRKNHPYYDRIFPLRTPLWTIDLNGHRWTCRPLVGRRNRNPSWRSGGPKKTVH